MYYSNPNYFSKHVVVAVASVAGAIAFLTVYVLHESICLQRVGY